MQTVKLNQKDIDRFTMEDIEDLALRLEQDDYNNPFEALTDWHLLRAIAFRRRELVEPYLYLLDIETYDES